MTGLKSAFLEKLPLEIRHQIYELVLGDNIIIITPVRRRVWQCFCRARGEKFHWFTRAWLEDIRAHCRTHEVQIPDEGYRREVEEVRGNRLSVLLTCRQMYVPHSSPFGPRIWCLQYVIRSYSESAKVLWSARPIHMQILGGPLYFRVFPNMQASLAPRHFHAIRTLEISFGHSKLEHWAEVLDEEWFAGWNSVWDVVKDMKGLVQIQAWLKMEQAGDPGGNFMTAEQERRLFAPLMEVHHLQDFNVEVTWPENEASKELLRNAPFQLTRKDEPKPNQPDEYTVLRIYEHPSSARRDL